MTRSKQQTQTTRPSHGLAIYVKDSVNVLNYHCYSPPTFEFMVVKTKYLQKEEQIVVVYKSPALSLKKFVSELKQELRNHIDTREPLVIIGDFNIDISKTSSFECLVDKMFLCQQLIHEPTRDRGSILDLIFSNHNGCAGTVESYWSDHNFIFLYS